jgi:hypothetical protein
MNVLLCSHFAAFLLLLFGIINILWSLLVRGIPKKKINFAYRHKCCCWSQGLFFLPPPPLLLLLLLLLLPVSFRKELLIPEL